MSIYPDRRRDGVLTGKFRVELNVNGRRKRGRASTLQEAKALEVSMMRELTTTGASSAPVVRIVRPEGVTLAEAREKAKGILWDGQSTASSSERKLDRILHIWGLSTKLDDVDTNKVDELVQHLKDAGYTAATINRYLSCVSAFLRFCKARGHRKSPLPELEWRTEDEGRVRWLTYKEEDTLLELLPDPFKSLVYIDLRTGFRAMELLTLVPDQVTPQWVHLWKTKNHTTRSVPITKDVHDRLWPLVSERRMPTYRQLNIAWEKARATMGLKSDPLFVFHACRHTYATRAVEAGVNIRVLQQLMGHKTIQTTLRYAHVADNTLSDAVAKMHAFHSRAG